MGHTSYDFHGDTVLVTGGSSGIGRDIALEFANAGATVINASRRKESKDADGDTPTHERINDQGGESEFVKTDVSNVAEIEQAVAACRKYGGLDIMVNNAGIHIGGSVLDVTPEQFDRIHQINVRGYFFGCQAAAADMIQRDATGSIINIASISSTMAKPGQIVYESTKGAIRMITRSASLDLVDHDIRVNAIAPGRIATEFADGMSAEEMARTAAEGDMLKSIPMQRAGFPEDVSYATLFIASEEADYITGEMLYVDGGYQTY